MFENRDSLASWYIRVHTRNVVRTALPRRSGRPKPSPRLYKALYISAKELFHFCIRLRKHAKWAPRCTVRRLGAAPGADDTWETQEIRPLCYCKDVLGKATVQPELLVDDTPDLEG